MRKGNKNNAILNGEWASHVRGKLKRFTSRWRRIESKKEIRRQVSECDWEILSPENRPTLPEDFYKK
jgi:hypothetical protein